uniref:Uncharacterized protein n=1 Tax=Tetraodon nigroviridis TaxID=99883 RepID=H3C6V5_TETNG
KNPSHENENSYYKIFKIKFSNKNGQFCILVALLLLFAP